MKAKDVMESVQEYLRPYNTLKESANILMTVKCRKGETGVRGLPVLDNEGRLIGFLAWSDIINAVFPPYMSLMELGEFTWDGMVEDMAKKVKSKKVSELMTKEVISVKEESPLMECVADMIKHRIKSLPVLNKEHKVVGILYDRDIFYAITKVMLEENNPIEKGSKGGFENTGGGK